MLLASAVLDAAQSMPLVVHVIDYAHVDSWDLGQAEHYVAQMFGRVGVRTIWREERASSADPDNTKDVTVVILSRIMSERMVAANHLAKGVLGTAIHPSRRAWLYFDAIERAAVDRDLAVGMLLGQVIAHEIGHAVGNLAHTDHGTMQAVLNRGLETFQGFTKVEGQLIRATLSRPVERGTASVLATNNLPRSVP